MRRFMNGRTFTVLALLLCAASVAASFALFSSWKTAENHLYVGHNEIEVEEDFEPPSKLERDTTFRKTVRVRNTGNVPCYVRVFDDFSDSEIRKIAKFSPDGDNFYSVDEYPTTVTAPVYFPRYTGTSGSINTALSSLGIDSSFAYRKTIATANNIAGYSGTAAQNTTMCNLLKQGKLIDPSGKGEEYSTPENWTYVPLDDNPTTGGYY